MAPLKGVVARYFNDELKVLAVLEYEMIRGAYVSLKTYENTDFDVAEYFIGNIVGELIPIFQLQKIINIENGQEVQKAFIRDIIADDMPPNLEPNVEEPQQQPLPPQAERVDGPVQLPGLLAYHVWVHNTCNMRMNLLFFIKEKKSSLLFTL
uniref:Uncharacterized protein n=1 Tax=Panagrolaimus sp. ES5 TaxID=591445 RepID=A0AC34F6H8_9BILA